MEKILKFDTNNGLDLNVQKYKELPLRPVPVDVEKTHTTLDNLSALEEKLTEITTRVQTRKNSLYDENHVPRNQWASDELEYLEEKLKTLNQLQKCLTSLHSAVSNTYKLLNARFNRDTVAREERKRVARRKKEQRKKEKRRKKEIGKKQAAKLILTTHGQDAADAFLAGSNDASKISSTKLGSIPLLPRFHIAALRHLIDNNAVDDVSEANRLLDILICRKANKGKACEGDDIYDSSSDDIDDKEDDDDDE